jgi:hypothetical protein
MKSPHMRHRAARTFAFSLSPLGYRGPRQPHMRRDAARTCLFMGQPGPGLFKRIVTAKRLQHRRLRRTAVLV